MKVIYQVQGYHIKKSERYHTYSCGVWFLSIDLDFINKKECKNRIIDSLHFLQMMHSTFFILIISALIGSIVSPPTHGAHGTPEPSVECTEECELDLSECEYECREDIVTMLTRDQLVSCSKLCTTEYQKCQNECQEDAIEAAEEAQQDAPAETAGEQADAGGAEGAGAGGADTAGADAGTNAGGEGTADATGGDAQETEGRDLVMGQLANQQSQNAGALSNAIDGGANQEGVVVNHASGSGSTGNTAAEQANAGSENAAAENAYNADAADNDYESDYEFHENSDESEDDDSDESDDDSEESDESEEDDRRRWLKTTLFGLSKHFISRKSEIVNERPYYNQWHCYSIYILYMHVFFHAPLF